MTTKFSVCDFADEDFIDIELTSSPQTRDFSFQIQISSTSFSNQTTPTTSSADELFYNGKLLPLHHLPHRRRQLLQITEKSLEEDINYFTIPFITCSSAPCTNTNTPCNISPTESCRASCELNPEEQHFFQWSTELTQLSSLIKKKRLWSRKLKLVKHFKASKTYLKSIFTKSSSTSDESTQTTEAEDKYFKIMKNNPTIGSIMKNIEKEQGMNIEENNLQRRSFSGAIKRHSPAKCLSSSSSSSSSSLLNSNGFSEQLLRRSSSAIEVEGSIEAAIAHCKKSQKILDLEGNQKRPGHCSI